MSTQREKPASNYWLQHHTIVLQTLERFCDDVLLVSELTGDVVKELFAEV